VRALQEHWVSCTDSRIAVLISKNMLKPAVAVIILLVANTVDLLAVDSKYLSSDIILNLIAMNLKTLLPARLIRKS